MKKQIFTLCLLALLSFCIVSCDSAKTTEQIPNSPSDIPEQSSPEKDPSVLSPSTEGSNRPAEEPSPSENESMPSASKEEPSPTPSPEECTHTFGDWQTVTQATCQKEGQHERTCTRCGEKEEEPIEKAAHTEVSLPAQEATCTKTGLSAGTQCSVCNTVLQKQEIIPAKDHTPVTDKAVAATCTKTGLSEGSHCSVCDKVLKKQQIIPIKDHTSVTDKAVAATCTKTGLSEGSHCSVCNKVLKKQETIAVKTHEYQNGTCKACGALKESEGLEFTETTGGYALSGIGTCTDKVIVIPSSYDGKPVVRISYKALETDERIERIIIPDSVEVLENYAISPRYFVCIEVGANAKAENYAFNIRSSACAEIYNRSKYALSSKAISEGAFVNVYTPASGKSTVEQTDEGYVFVTVKGKAYLADYRGSSKEPVLPALYNGKSYEIAAFAFSETDIDSVKMQDGVTAIYQCAFENSSVSSIIFSQKLTKIGHACFMNCKNLKEVVLPDSVIEIGTQCFYESGIQTATIGKSLKTAGHSMFDYCPNLDTLYYNATDCAIDGLEGFKKLVIGKNVKTISDRFMASSKLEEIVIEEDTCLERIGGSAFAGSSIDSIIIPETVELLGNAFKNCKNLKTIQSMQSTAPPHRRLQSAQI